MNKLQLLRHSYSSRLQAYWNSQSLLIQRALLLTTFTLYTFVCLFIVKTSFTSKIISKQETRSNIKPAKYLLDRQKIESQPTSKTKNYESRSIIK